MHKLILVAFAGAVLTTFYTSAVLAAGERDGPYVRGDAGISFQEMESFDSGYDYKDDRWNQEITMPVVGLGFGYKLGPFRADLTFDYRPKKDLDKFLDPISDYRRAEAHITSYGVMANGYWDIHTVGLGHGFGDTKMTLTPYVGAGVGGTILDVETAAATQFQSYAKSYEKHNFTWAAMVGAAIQVTEMAAIDVGYRYQDLGPLPTSKLGFEDLTTHDLRIGLRYSF